MSFLPAKRLSSFCPSFPSLPPLLRLSLSLSFSTTTSDQNQKETPFVVKYLVSSFGFSPDRALKVSSYPGVALIKSSERPESVVRFLTDIGFSDSQIKTVVSFNPNLLGSNVDKTLKPNMHRLMDVGVSKELLVHLIRYNPAALSLKDTPSRLLFWKNFVGNCDKLLFKVIQRNALLITFNIDKLVLPRINFLNEYGLSNRDIAQLLGSGCNVLNRGIDSLRVMLEFIEQNGTPRGSRMFFLSVKAIGNYSKDKLDSNVAFFKMTYGWSQEEVSCAFKKFPFVLTLSQNKIKESMNFLVRKVMLEPRSIACQPKLLAYSLKKRLVPRHHVLSILAAKGLKKNLRLSSVSDLTENMFLERFVLPHKKDVPELMEAYLSASAGNILV